MSRSRRVSLVARGARALAAVGLVIAQTATAADSTQDKRVVVHATGNAVEVDALGVSLRELLARTGTSLVVASETSPIAVDEGAIAVVRVTFSANGETQLAIVNGRTGRESRRNVSAEPALRVEATAHVIQFAVEDLLVAPPPPAEPVPPPAPAPPPEPVASAPVVTENATSARYGLDVGAEFGGRSFGGGAGAVIGGGVSLELTRGRGNGRLGLLAVGQIHAPAEGGTPLITVRTTVVSVRLLPTIQLVGGRSWALHAGAGGGTDVWLASSASADVPSSRLFEQTRATPIGTALLAGHVAVGKSADLELIGLLDVDFAPHRYVAEDRGQHETLFLANRVRPALLLGFTFTMAGLDPYPARAEKTP